MRDKPKGSGDFSIGSPVWPGLSKLIEECGEVVQVAGKLLGTHGEAAHWDGTDLRLRLQEELADLRAAMLFVIDNNGLDERAINRRINEKMDLYRKWHAKGDPLPAPHDLPCPRCSGCGELLPAGAKFALCAPCRNEQL